jgi:two-component system, cell cycle sensor histidine kinase and response regulator CckA
MAARTNKEPLERVGGARQAAGAVGAQSAVRPAADYSAEVSDRERALEHRVAELEHQQQQLEAQVRGLHRVKTMIDLLAGTAHDMSSALTGIVWASEAIRRRLGMRDPDLDAGIADFVSAAHYTRKLAQRLISVGRRPEAEHGSCSLRAIVEQSLELLDAMQPPSVSCVTALQGGDVRVLGSSDQLQQVIVNIVSNAFDAMRERGGQLHVELARAPGLDGDKWWRITVRDTGPGMDPDTLSRAFEPFFTTKQGAEGNGLGLVVVRTIVEGHGGRIKLDSALGVGTQVELRFPAY